MAVTIMALAAACIGQERIASEVWHRYHRKAFEICRATPHRVTVTIEERTSPEAAWQFYSRSETEYDGRNSHFRGKYLEIIQIGKIRYKKQPDGSWKKIEGADSVATVEVIQRSPPQFTSINGAAEYMQINANGDVVILQLDARYKKKYFRTGLLFDHHDIQRVWFDEHGRFLRNESFTYDPHRSNYIHRIAEFEYDPNIHIEDPGAA